MKVVNNKAHSVDGLGILKGRAAYTDDLADKNSLIVKALRSPHAYARIKSIDDKLAKELPGVEMVLTYKDFPRIPFTRAGQGYPEPSPYDKFVLDEYVRYVGDEVVAVAAIDNETCEKALSLIKVEYEILEPVLDFENAVDNKIIIHPEPEIHDMFPIGFEPKRNIAASYKMHVGDVEKTISECDYVVNETFYTQAQAHVMMEPHTVNARMDYQERLVIYSATQTPFHMRRIISSALEIPITKIRFIKPRVGGGFGGKQAIHGEMLVAWVTWKTGKPAKMVFTRKEVFESSYSRHPMRMDVTLGADKSGKLKAIDFKCLSDTGAYGEHALTVFMVVGSKVLPLYNKVETVRFHGDIVYTNKTPAGAFRGYGAIQGNFALESAVDILCHKMGIDPIEFRQKNMMKENETSPIFAIMGEGTEGTAMDMETCKLEECVQRGMELIGWKDKYPRVESNNKIKSVGMAIAMQGSGIPYIDMGSATIKLNDQGFYNLLIGATDIGQGSDTILAQIAAEVLMTTIDKVIVYSSDTDLTPFDCGAYASSTTYVSGNAVFKAAMNMKNAIIKEAARVLETQEADVEFDGKILTSSNGKTVSLEDLSNQLFYSNEQKQLSVTSSYVGHKSPPPFMAGFVEIDIDKETGEVDIVDYVSVVDCGTTINPLLAEGQVNGAIVQGLGMAMFEDVKYSSNGKMISNSLINYKIPTRVDIKKLTTEFVDSYETSGPFGAKSVGEIGIDTPPAALANAVYNALGIRINALPITPEKILLSLKEKENK
ncbi:xanthine dehydrogenase family protein molybdopterin-binding subunit [Candidatus Izemoplasma sp. B36]|uniref:xanthine dehydrogenase family protein molybdopterin-binding subunit n=1 Tax=Candidatus Izemoplasma sp. B36 TaxID=3242468 RepID=UPI003556B9BF